MASSMSRRAFLTGTATAAGAVALGCTDRSITAPMLTQIAPAALPDPASSGIEHVVVFMMENRSFDHFLGWLPGADGRQAGLTYVDSTGAPHATFPLAPDFQGCGYEDPDHSYEGGRVEYNDGACDGWLRVNDVFSIGYYRQQDLAFLGRAVPDWTSFDRYFCSILGPTVPNRIYQHAGQTDRIANTLAISLLPTIWDRLAVRGLVGRYYYTDLPFLALWGAKYLPIGRPIDAFYADCAAGTLPHVAFVDGSFLQELTGTGADDHPYSDIRAGEAMMNRIYTAVTRSPAWKNTVLVINFDEWGGFFDHVPPPLAPIPPADLAAGNVDGRLGFRTPTVLVSPFARRVHTSSVQYDHTSVLRMIEWRWGLAPLTVRDATANNLADELDFTLVDTTPAPVYSVPDVTGAFCPISPTEIVTPVQRRRLATRTHWAQLADVAQGHRWRMQRRSP
ncbi:MAG TPA: alkaline phosphatase family protein [Gemmatimonadales bacterium]|jgi:phospholipase C|nr:alkaline phosphatase family protein [Gemmatimonadales bacterium]